MWWSQAVFGSVVLLPIKSLATGAIQGATSLRGLSWRGRLGIVLHTVLFFLLLWILPYRTMRQARMDALGLASAPLVMPGLVLRMAGLFTCFQTTVGTFFGRYAWLADIGSEANQWPGLPLNGRPLLHRYLHPKHAPDEREHGCRRAQHGQRRVGAAAGGDGGQLCAGLGLLVHHLRWPEPAGAHRVLAASMGAWKLTISHPHIVATDRAPPLPWALARYPPQANARHPADLPRARRSLHVSPQMCRV